MNSPKNGRIPESFIQSVLSKTDIVSVIQEHLPLQKKGANYSACCPFHQEKTPSFTVNQGKQFYHCFGCGAHGDAIHFLMEQQSLNFIDALENLAQRLGMSIPKDPAALSEHKEKDRITAVLDKVNEFYRAQLKKPANKIAIDYLKNRGLTGQIAKKFAIGFAPSGWDNLIKHFGGDENAVAILEETGLIIKHTQGHFYDRFRNRIMFPIRDKRGETIGFGGRVIDESQPKYLNSPESRVFLKGHCLYGIYEALQNKKWSKAIVVEGYLDVIGLSQFGIEGALGSMGTAITASHLTYLFHITNDVVFCFDGDKAGQNAAWKALQLAMPLLKDGRQVHFAHLPYNEDPDSYVRRCQTEEFQHFINNSLSLSEYFFSKLTEKIKPHSLDDRAKFIDTAGPMIESMPPSVLKEMMFEELAKITQTNTNIVHGKKTETYSNADKSNFYQGKKWNKDFYKGWKEPAPIIPSLQTVPSAGLLACALLLHYPQLQKEVKAIMHYAKTATAQGTDLLLYLLDWLETNTFSSLEAIYQHLETKGFSSQSLRNVEDKIALIPDEGKEAELWGSIRRLEAIGQRQYAEKLLSFSKIRDLTPSEKTILKEILHFRESN